MAILPWSSPGPVRRGKFGAAAESLYQQALAIVKKTLGPDHPYVATVLENISELYKETGRMDEAKRVEERANAIRSRNK